VGASGQRGQASKGEWGMTWRPEAMKGVADCENSRGAVEHALILESLNQPAMNT